MNIHHHLDPFDDPLLSSISLVSRLSRSSSSIMMMRKQMSLLALVLSLSAHSRLDSWWKTFFSSCSSCTPIFRATSHCFWSQTKGICDERKKKKRLHKVVNQTFFHLKFYVSFTFHFVLFFFYLLCFGPRSCRSINFNLSTNWMNAL